MLQPFENDIFVEENFSNANFNDTRLSKRLCIIAKKFSVQPQASISKQMENWNDTVSCYNFLRNSRVTHKRIQEPHRKKVKESAIDAGIKGDTVLFIQDLSELDYSTLKGTEGLGQVGNQYGKGIQMHSCLAVRHIKNKDIDVLGLAHQIVWERKDKKSRGKPKIGEQFRGEKESVAWSQTLRALGSPPPNVRWVSVCDRGSDIYEYLSEVKRLKWQSVIRAFQDRCIKVDGAKRKLMEFVRSLESKDTYTIPIRKRDETKKRDITINISWASTITLTPSESVDEEVEVSVIRCWNEEEKIEWILYSTIKVNNNEEALEKVIWYSNRWCIEEYHKCIKTGCKIESSQLETSKSLESLVGVLGIIAILMLCMKSLARDAGTELAEKYVPQIPLKIVCRRFNLNLKTLTIYEFWRTVARMGGFLNRKSDGEPGWQTLWLGWLRLLDMIEGAEAFTHDQEFD